MTVKDKVILLIEDNPDDELLTIRALKKHNVANRVDVVHDGAMHLACGHELRGVDAHCLRDEASILQDR